MRTVTLVVGPPCAGKSTYVARRAQPGDVVVDFDSIARRLGSPQRWVHPEPWRTAADREVERMVAEVEVMTVGVAWVIRCLPSLADRAALGRRLAARVVVVDPGERVCLARAALRPSGTARAIRRWYWAAQL